MKVAGDLYYYCLGCKKFHEYEKIDHKGVNRKLCFYCFKIQPKKTKIIGDAEGRMQICETCYKELF
ncbi:hypothetical protein P9Z59_21360 [Bacillus thuringiensis]|uniref:hypothetical protein n=1 Tax=Bacillus cereus group TaxID=86661 RepID=UPI001F5A00DF|nr:MULTISPECIES: hypothetical protein [Bacillus cereus group]MEC2884158.1 hypothetical protein [Bacillus thuringiensis]MED2582075.1 hypothetical protein [Bacillus thuringiensis]MED2627768.1 hypothetical protein [Bacillus thuringiensis]MED2675011.1 hypothetical protein [Bacillus thuringiensis]MED2889280.1 hypothetical protein [Bacillus thuringiensis]